MNKKIIGTLITVLSICVLSAQDQTENKIKQQPENKLKEVVISGNREKQKREEVPASISVISQKEIQTIKPIGLESIVNNASGVYLATSAASSNEQHFMAARSPISTKGLFLYLEDGLPIRPTSVFNHNALLEMNRLSIERVEVLKGPASSIYGSEAIGGSFNFLTKKPTREFTGNVQLEMNTLGITQTGVEASTYLNKNTGIYIAASYAQRKDQFLGENPMGHSDYEKTATTIKTTHKLSNRTQLTNVLDAIDYRSDMSGSINEEDYIIENYESDQTYTERDALAIRFRSTLETRWNEINKTTFNGIFRYNEMGQIPSYKINQFRGTGEINNNQFRSFAGLIQHKYKPFGEVLSLIGGISADFSPQKYVANSTSITFDPITRINTGYTVNTDDFIANYNANILNLASYLQAEYKPLDQLLITGAIRADYFEYDFNNQITDADAKADRKDTWNNLAPKLGINYNFNTNMGVFANYTTGFTPPQTATLYRDSDESINLKPSFYENFELGGYFFVLSKKLKLDWALYALNGKDTLISIRDEADVVYNTNAGKTQSLGVEYAVSYSPTEEITLSHNGSFANHTYKRFFNDGIDYSNTDRETAPKLIGNTRLNYTPKYIKGLNTAISHELVGKYNTSFEGQATNAEANPTTTTYAGHNIFNFTASYTYRKFEFWGHVLNILDKQYANRASFSPWRNANSYTVGNPRAFHFGVRYHFN